MDLAQRSSQWEKRKTEKKSREEKVKFCRLREDSQGKPHGKEKEKRTKLEKREQSVAAFEINNN